MTPAAFARWIFFDGPRLALPFRCLVASVCVYCASCTLSAPQRAAIVSVEGALLCSALLPLAWPGGGSADALVCQGSEGALSAALASLPAPAAGLVPSSPGAGPPPPLERRPVHAHGKLVGFMPASIATDVQRRLDGAVR